jgi:penicillin-binding protein 1A
MVRIERRTGRRVFGAWPSNSFDSPIIWEAFKPETEPRRTIRQDEVAQPRTARPAASGQANRASQGQSQTDFLERQGGGGIY